MGQQLNCPVTITATVGPVLWQTYGAGVWSATITSATAASPVPTGYLKFKFGLNTPMPPNMIITKLNFGFAIGGATSGGNILVLTSDYGFSVGHAPTPYQGPWVMGSGTVCPVIANMLMPAPFGVPLTTNPWNAGTMNVRLILGFTDAVIGDYATVSNPYLDVEYQDADFAAVPSIITPATRPVILPIRQPIR